MRSSNTSGSNNNALFISASLAPFLSARVRREQQQPISRAQPLPQGVSETPSIDGQQVLRRQPARLDQARQSGTRPLHRRQRLRDRVGGHGQFRPPSSQPRHAEELDRYLARPRHAPTHFLKKNSSAVRPNNHSLSSAVRKSSRLRTRSILAWYVCSPCTWN